MVKLLGLGKKEKNLHDLIQAFYKCNGIIGSFIADYMAIVTLSQSGRLKRFHRSVFRFEKLLIQVNLIYSKNFSLLYRKGVPDWLGKELTDHVDIINASTKIISEMISHVDRYKTTRFPPTTCLEKDIFCKIANICSLENEQANNYTKALDDKFSTFLCRFPMDIPANFLKEVDKEFNAIPYVECQRTEDLLNRLDEFTRKTMAEQEVSGFRESLNVLNYEVEDILDFFNGDNALKMRIQGIRKKLPKEYVQSYQFTHPDYTGINGLGSIGPFAIVPVDEDVLRKDFVYNGVNFWLVETIKRRTLTHYLVMSPPVKITVDDDPDTFNYLKIPEAATKFSFVYPLATTIVAAEEEFEDGKSLVINYGGYIYFDKDNKPIALNGLKAGGCDVFFAGPYKIQNDVFAQLKPRMRDVTIQAIYDKNATHFGWANPNELPNSPYGAFFYRYSNTWCPTYFTLVKYNRKVELEANRANNENHVFIENELLGGI